MDMQKPVGMLMAAILLNKKKIITVLVVAAVIVAIALLITGGSTENFRSKYEGRNLEEDISGVGREGTYSAYLHSHDHINFKQLATRAVYPLVYEDIENAEDEDTKRAYKKERSADDALSSEPVRIGEYKALSTKAGGETRWNVKLDEAGEYSIRIDYTLPEGGDQALRRLLINDTLVFNVSNSEDPAYGAQLFKPGEEDGERWHSLYLYAPDSINERDVFDFPAGYSTLSLTSDADGGELIIKDIVLEKKESDVSYDAYDYRGEAIGIDITSYTDDPAGPACELVNEDSRECVFQPDSAVTAWKVNVPESGFYNILIEYKTTESRGVDIERALYIINAETEEDSDGLPFTGASTLTFSRLWTDDPTKKNADGSFATDNQGNEIRPSQTEVFDWQSAYLRDSMGYTVEPYRFWLEEGENTLILEANNEPFIIGSIELTPVQQHITYAQYAAANAGKENNVHADTVIIVEGESALLRSSPSLYPKYDRSSPSTQPSSLDKTVMNYIGGDSWSKAGQWIQWEFTVPEDGYYNITVKGRQQYQRGAISCRSVYIDGEIPFDEISAVSFGYDTSWNMLTLADPNGEAYEFYLTKGTHTIRLEATLGEMGQILSSMEDCIYRLNQIYRRLLVLTGVNPDRFRDYDIPKNIPGIIDAMELESLRLYKLVDDTVAITGQKSDRIAVAQTLAVQLEQYVDRNERITQSFSNFKDNITSLGTSLQNMSETKLDIDRIYISAPGASLGKVSDGGLQKFWHEIKSCATSYFVDYNSLGNKYSKDADHVITVWIVTGRDQSTVLKTMVDDMFTPQSGINVNVKLVAADALLTAVVAGNGPDVVLSVDGWFAANYAMRNAVEDLTQFADFEEVTGIDPAELEDVNDYGADDGIFKKSAIVPLCYNDGKHTGVYGLPETQVFWLMFYREDILKELGIVDEEGNAKPPETWDELISLLPTIQGNNMTVGIPYPDITNVDMSVFNSLIYQNGGTIYDKDAMQTTIDSEAGVAAFKLYTSFYNNYGLPTVYDFNTRFRSGEMPIGIAPYTTYNTLAVSAPEIRNLWDFTLIPGTPVTDENGEVCYGEDGEMMIDRSVHSAGACCMLIATDDETVKADAWEFMKWWVSEDAQVRFGREMESILGSSARYATANTNALRRLAWSSAQLEVLEMQRDWAVGFREIAGGYSTTRHMTNAVRRVINTKEDPRETLLNYTRTINEEIKIKRQEFGLPTEKTEDAPSND